VAAALRGCTLLCVALGTPAAHALPPGCPSKATESASFLVRGCAPERHDEFVQRFDAAVARHLTPAFEDHWQKLKRSEAALEAARADYLECVRKAREQDAVPKEACAGPGEHFRERESTLRILRSQEARDALGRRVLPGFVKAMQAIAADFPACDLRKLKVLP
jgi:hypothetical protein